MCCRDVQGQSQLLYYIHVHVHRLCHRWPVECAETEYSPYTRYVHLDRYMTQSI